MDSAMCDVIATIAMCDVAMRDVTIATQHYVDVCSPHPGVGWGALVRPTPLSV